MKVVLFCGGQGLRLRDYSENVPKPMVPVGYRPIIWHLMKYYAHYGHTDFILCCGYKADVIKDYFLNYNECLSNDFVLSGGGRQLTLLGSDIDKWKITFVDTGVEANVGQRLKTIEPFIGDDEAFLANYSDALTDCPLPVLIDHAQKLDKVAHFISVHPSQTFHVAQTDPNDVTRVQAMVPVTTCDVYVNGGFFYFKREIFDHLDGKNDLVEGALTSLIAKDQVATMRYTGFWACMDTFKEKMVLDDMSQKGNAPWEIWKKKAGTNDVLIKSRSA